MKIKNSIKPKGKLIILEKNKGGSLMKKRFCLKMMNIFLVFAILVCSIFTNNTYVNAQEVLKNEKKVDIAFVVDTTGSMDSAINEVKNSITEFVSYLESQGIDLQIGIVEYWDITSDGDSSTVVHTDNHTPWHTSTEQLVQTLSNLSIYGGGDRPETLIDGLACLVNESGNEETTMRWSSDAYKFAFVLTDADYKMDNNYGYESIEQIISKWWQAHLKTNKVLLKELIQKVYFFFWSTY